MEEAEWSFQNDALKQRAKAFVQRMGAVTTPSAEDRREFQTIRREIHQQQRREAAYEGQNENHRRA
ncbi:MAG: hypothetical protein JEY71_10395 [Sphaerochaeta sp.]|nr:hypothetical protein [Sphaerochaeta sp.]